MSVSLSIFCSSPSAILLLVKSGLRYSFFTVVSPAFEFEEGLLLLELLLVFDDVVDDVGLLDVLLLVVSVEVASLEVDSASGLTIFTTHDGVS